MRAGAVRLGGEEREQEREERGKKRKEERETAGPGPAFSRGFLFKRAHKMPTQSTPKRQVLIPTANHE